LGWWEGFGVRGRVYPGGNCAWVLSDEKLWFLVYNGMDGITLNCQLLLLVLPAPRVVTSVVNRRLRASGPWLRLSFLSLTLVCPPR